MLTSYVTGKCNFSVPEQPQTSHFLTLSEYIKFSRRAISKFNNTHTARYMLTSEDAVSWVAEAIMLNDWRYEGAGYSRLAVRIRMAQWAILNYLTEIQKEQHTIPLSSLDDYFINNIMVKRKINYLETAKTEFDQKIAKESAEQFQERLEAELKEDIGYVFRSKFDKILSEAGLSERQEQCIRLKFEESKNEVQIAQILGCSRQNVNQCIFNGLYKVKKLYAMAS